MNTRDEAATVFVLFFLYIIVLIVIGFPFGGPLGEVGEYIGLVIFLGMGIVAVLCILSKVCDDDPNREKAMRRQIELEKQKLRKRDDDDDEQRDWILT